MPSGVESFPPAVQMVLTTLGFLFAVVVWSYGYLKKPRAEISKDVVVPNVNVMDSMAIKEAAAALRENMRRDDERERLIREMMVNVKAQTEFMEASVRLLKESNDILESIDDRMKKEHFANRQERDVQSRRPT